ncbi:MAG: hypothetical protein M1818_001115 [Claussenomyces sp. TS43310]|nr:MAG: hypothetical protein M1818_001115 [Claussenomyces sp. TS43310]
METDYRAYLAATILSEDRVVSRLDPFGGNSITANKVSVDRSPTALSVELSKYTSIEQKSKVMNCWPCGQETDVSYRMLFEFHRQQNRQNPGTVNATYLIAGNKKKALSIPKDSEDGTTQRSLYKSSPILYEAIEEEDSILSITVDIQVLTDVARETPQNYTEPVPPTFAKMYGTITNISIRRPTGRRLLPSSPANPAISIEVPAPILNGAYVNDDGITLSSALFAQEKAEAQYSKTSARKEFFAKDPAQTKASSNLPHIKRESFDIFKSFAKARPISKREDTDSSTGVSASDSRAPSIPGDEPMKDVSEDEEVDDISTPYPKGPSDRDRNCLIKREAALKKMMEDNDSEDEGIVTLKFLHSEPTKVDLPTETAEEALTISNVAANGRRRGRRRIMKRKTTQDEEGYLVTREEPAWESFSEDEPAMPKCKAPGSSIPASMGNLKRGTGKGQGNIMSFFAKK